MEVQPRHVELATEPVDTGTASFEAFFADEWDRLFRAVILLTGSREEAEDVTQGAFLSLLERWDTLDQGADREGYLFRTALNGYRSLYRRAKLATKRVLTPGRAGADPFEQVAELLWTGALGEHG